MALAKHLPINSSDISNSPILLDSIVNHGFLVSCVRGPYNLRPLYTMGVTNKESSISGYLKIYGSLWSRLWLYHVGFGISDHVRRFCRFFTYFLKHWTKYRVVFKKTAQAVMIHKNTGTAKQSDLTGKRNWLLNGVLRVTDIWSDASEGFVQTKKRISTF